MATESGNSPKAPAVRGQVSKSFYGVNVLAGFMDDGHFNGYAQEHLGNLNKRQRDALMKKVQAARDAVSKLNPLSPDPVELRPLEDMYWKHFTKDKIFATSF